MKQYHVCYRGPASVFSNRNDAFEYACKCIYVSDTQKASFDAWDESEQIWFSYGFDSVTIEVVK